MSPFEHGVIVFSVATAAIGLWLLGLSKVVPVFDSYWQRLPAPTRAAGWKAVESGGLTAQSVGIMAYGFWTTSVAYTHDPSFGGFLSYCGSNWWAVLGGSIIGPAYRARQGFIAAGGKTVV